MSSIVVFIQACSGGDDAKMFAEDLANLYIKYGQRLNLTHRILKSGDGTYKIRFEGKKATSAFKHEAGKHCVQRIPPTESKGRRQTSYVSVAVMKPRVVTLTTLDPSEVTITTQRGHGKGGQHQNKTDSAVRAVHEPTGLEVFINGRKQKQNRDKALEILTQRVNALRQEKIDSKHRKEKKAQVGDTGRGDKIRTYNFLESRVVDHRLNRKTTKLSKVMKGRLDLLIGRV